MNLIKHCAILIFSPFSGWEGGMLQEVESGELVGR